MNRYAIADLHGQLDLLEQVKEYLNEDDVLYILGDSGDRGPHPWQTLKASLDDPRFIYLMGNHDLMLIKAIEQYIKIPESELMYGLAMYMGDRTPIGQLALNGGTDTLLGWAREPERMKYYQKLRFAPLEVRLAALDGEHFIYLTHAGYSPHLYNPDNVDTMVWDREHFYDRPAKDKSLLIHGHTPTQIMTKKLKQCGRALEFDDSNEYCIYADDTKINIDIGAYFYNKTVLLNIDTLEGKIFTTKGES
jgi:calcineurin-like phosphoesterase family protein